MTQKNLFLFFLGSLLLHLLLMLLGHWAPWPGSRPTSEKNDPIEVEILNPEQSYQIADIAPPEHEEKPEKAKFLGLYNSKVVQEQVAPSHRPSSKGTNSPAENQEDKKAGWKKQGTFASPHQKEQSTPPSAAGDPFDPFAEDFYPDYKVGERTYLNVFRFPKVEYFVRLKKIFKTTFNPVPAIRSSLTSNQISQGKVEVVLGVTVNAQGNLADLVVLRSSGMPAYDQECLRTIRDSSPFSAPPRELLTGGSRLQMAWTFSVYL